MASLKELKPVKSQPGRPLYMVVRDAVREAVDAGIFSPGEQMPSTKELSEQLEVSLVTTHRALQELVTSGVLQRSQGKGTFVHERYRDRKRTLSEVRLGLVFHAEASLADYYHSQILEGVRQAAQQHAVDLILLRFGEDVRNECNGFLFVNPLPGEIEAFVAESPRKAVLAVGAKSDSKRVHSIDVDNVDLAAQAVKHLAERNHKAIAYVGGDDRVSNNRDRRQAFLDACKDYSVAAQMQLEVRSSSWRLDDQERAELVRLLTGAQKPTAIFAAGYHFALAVYAAAAEAGVRIPQDLSVVGVDDPASAALLSPPMTTLRQPLVELGRSAVTALFRQIQNEHAIAASQSLQAELVVRQSTAPAR